MIPRGVCIPYTVCPVAFREKNLHFPLQDPARDYPLSSYLYLFGLLGGFCPLAKTPVVRGEAIKNFAAVVLLLRSRGSKGRRGGGDLLFLVASSFKATAADTQQSREIAKKQRRRKGGDRVAQGKIQAACKHLPAPIGVAEKVSRRVASLLLSALTGVVPFRSCKGSLSLSLSLSPSCTKPKSQKSGGRNTAKREREKRVEGGGRDPHTPAKFFPQANF